MARISIAGKAKKAGKEQSGEEVLKVDVRTASGAMVFDIALGQPAEYSTTVELEMGLPAGLPQAEGAPGKMPLKTVSVGKLVAVETLENPVSEAGGDGKRKAKSVTGESAAEKKARRKARKEKRKAEKAKQ